MTGKSGNSADIKYICTPLPQTPNGKQWETFEDKFMNAISGRADDRGYSLADHLLGSDEGGPVGPALPTGSMHEALALYGKRPTEHEGVFDASEASAVESRRYLSNSIEARVSTIQANS